MPLFNNNKKIGRVFHGTKEINKIYQGDKLVFQKLKPEGYIEIEVDSTSGEFIVPFSVYPTNSQYSFKIYVNGSLYATTTINSNYSTGTGYNITGLNGPTARIMLTPTGDTAPVGWGRAFGFYTGSNGCNIATNKAKLLKILNDPDYAHLQSETNTGSNFRTNQYRGCTSLTQILDEDMPDTVTTIGDQFRDGQYSDCVKLLEAAEESMPNSVTTIGTYFRYSQYNGCTSLLRVADEVMADHIINIPNIFRYRQYNGCVSLLRAADEVLPSGTTRVGTYFRREQYENCTNLTQFGVEFLPNSLTNVGDSFKYGQYNNCPNIRIGNYIHSYRFPIFLNYYNINYALMFGLSVANATPDEVPKYYTDSSNTTTAPITNLTPTAQKGYLRNRTGIPNYNNIDPFWK